MKISESWFQKLMEHTKCDTVDCLVQLSSHELISAYLAIPDGRCCRQLVGKPFIPWAPTIYGVELKAHPMDLVRQGQVNNVPMVMGTALDDAAAYFRNHSLSTEDLETLFDKYESRAALKPYLSEAHPTLQNYSNAWWASERVVTDQNFICPTHFASRTLSNATHRHSSMCWRTPRLLPQSSSTVTSSRLCS